MPSAEKHKPNAQGVLGSDPGGSPDLVPLSNEDLWRECMTEEDCARLGAIFLPEDRLWKGIGLMVTEDGVSIQVADEWYRPGWDHLMVAGIEMGARTISFRRAPQNAITFNLDLEEKVMNVHLISPTRESRKSEPLTEDAMRALAVPFALEDIMDGLVTNTQIIGVFHAKCLRWETMWSDCDIPGLRKMVERLVVPKDKNVQKAVDDAMFTLFDREAVRSSGATGNAVARGANRVIRRPDGQEEAMSRAQADDHRALAGDQTRLGRQFNQNDIIQRERTLWSQIAPALMAHLEVELPARRDNPQMQDPRLAGGIIRQIAQEFVRARGFQHAAATWESFDEAHRPPNVRFAGHLMFQLTPESPGEVSITVRAG